MDYKQLASDCIRLAGGRANIETASNCFTRLRFKLKDTDKADRDALKALPDVMDTQVVGQQLQIIIGPEVDKVFLEANKLLGDLSANAGPSAGEKDPKKEGIVSKILDVVSGIFGPIIPVITAAGLIKAVMAILVLAGLPNDSQEYYVINFISDATFYFFPILLGFSSGNKFGCNPYLAAAIGGVLVHPNFTALVTAGEPVSFFGLDLPLNSYSSSVLPIILTVFLMSFIERGANKITPKPLKAILVPLLTVIITAPIALFVTGPIGTVLGQGFSFCINFIESNVPMLVPTIVGAVCPLLVFAGMHHMLAPIAQVSIAQIGHESVMGPGMLASNVAQSAASFAVALRCKDTRNRSVAFSAGITALCGITEPALYGVTMKFKRPLVAVMIGGAVGGLFGGLTGVYRYSLGSPSVLTFPLFISEDPNTIWKAALMIVISFVVTFIVALILGFDEDVLVTDQTDGEKGANQAGRFAAPASVAARGTETKIVSPLAGTVVPLAEVNDKTFSSGVLGDGVAVLPTDNAICAPCDGVVTAVFATKHALGFTSDDGAEILVHMGINTVELEGAPFSIDIAPGERVTAGQQVGTMDVAAVRAAGYDPTTPVIVTNSNAYGGVLTTPEKSICRGSVLLFLEEAR